MNNPPTSTVSFSSIRYLTRPLTPGSNNEESVYDRFNRVRGADQSALQRTHILLIGCGGLGSEIGCGLMRKGIQHLSLIDHDTVELSNLARQLFYREDVGARKAFALAGNLRAHATGRTLIDAHACSFQAARDGGMDLSADIAVVGVDNNPTRLAAAEYYRARGIPVIFLAVDDQAAEGYVFVQVSRPETPCFECLFPDARQERAVHQCAGASVEILKIVAGIALYAIDSLLMERSRPWNYKQVFLDRGGDGHQWINPREACPLCAGMPVQLPARVSVRAGPG